MTTSTTKKEKVIVTNITKSFRIGFTKKYSTLARLLSFLSTREPKKKLEVLKGVSLTVYSGEILGIIGDNGSGKSTLLRIIAGIYHEDDGSVVLNGKVVSLINLGVGLKDRLTMRENIVLVYSLFGMSGKDLAKNFDTIVEFAGLRQFVDTKIYQFSSGMIQRLAFAIAIHANPEILILDEVFEVGDQDFRKKSSDKIKEMAAQGVAVIVVSHELDQIKKNCTRVVTMKNGVLQNS